jgi:hypothetical protein
MFFSNAIFSSEQKLDYVPQLPNIRVLSLRLVAVLGFISCPIAPIIFSFWRCPNLTQLHIDLSMLHQFSRIDPDYLMVPVCISLSKSSYISIRDNLTVRECIFFFIVCKFRHEISYLGSGQFYLLEKIQS